MQVLPSVIANGIASAMVLYVIAIGLSVTMGLMGFASLAFDRFDAFKDPWKVLNPR